MTPPVRALTGLALCALAVFITEMALMRAVAQVTWPPFAFLALSAAMLGGGLAGTVLALKPSWARRPGAAALGALLVALGSPAAMATVLLSGVEPLQVGRALGPTLLFVAVLLALGLPFVGLAVSLAALLERHAAWSFRIYASDLLGAGVGAFLSVALVDAAGVPASSALAGVLGGASALLLAPSRRLEVAGALAALLAGLAVLPGHGLLPNPTDDKRVGPLPASDVLKRLDDAGRLRFVDRSDGRVDVIPAKPAPSVLIDLGAAVTRSPLFPVKEPPRDAASAGFIARSPEGGDVLVIGSGAGYEVARALAYGAERVDAVEVSSAVVEVATNGSLPAAKRLYADPRVALHLDEARSFLERSDERWRHIVAVHTITNAAVSAQAMRLAEDFLLTRESLEALLDHLDDDGVLYMTRPAAQISLLADLARAALEARGVPEERVDDHLALLAPVVEDRFFRGLLVFQQPVDRGRLQAPPGLRVEAPPARSAGPLPTDERPFFHRLSDPVDDDARARLRIEGPQLAESAVVWVGGLATLVAVLALLLPLALRPRVAVPSLALSRPSTPHLAVAGLLGVGFMLLELALAQRLTLLCGRPAVAFAAVVGGMLLGAGAVALAVSSRRVPLRTALLLSALACAFSLAVPPLVVESGALALPGVLRAALAALLAGLVAAPLGLGFPALVDVTHRYAPGSAPWLYGINATTSVAASALHAGLAPSVGLSGTAVIAGLAYAAAALLASRWASGDRADA